VPIVPTPKELRRRQRLVRELMRRDGIDVLLVGSDGQHHHRGYLRYLLSWRTPSWEDYLIFPLDGEPTFFTHYSLRARWAREVFGIKDARSPPVGARHDTYVPHIVEEIEKHKPTTVGLASMQTLSGEFYAALARELTSAKITEASNVIDEVRLIKSPEELELYRKSAKVADVAYRTLLESIEPGRKEYEVIADVEQAAIQNGAEEVFYMFGSGPTPELKYNGMLDRRLKRGDLIVFTLEMPGPGGYWVELSRTVSIGQPKKSVSEAHDTIERAEKRAIEALRPGRTVSDVAKSMLEPIKSAGYEMMGQALGHSAGLDIFEKPLIEPGEKTVFKPGMVFSVHPHALTKEGAGCIVCNNYAVTDGGAQKLFKASSELAVV